MDYHKEISEMAKSSGMRFGQFIYNGLAVYMEEVENREVTDETVGDRIFFLEDKELYEVCNYYCNWMKNR